MSDREGETREGSRAGRRAGAKALHEARALPRWKKLALVLAGLFVVAGLVLAAAEDPAPDRSGSGATTVGPNTLVGGGTPGGEAGTETEPEGYSRFFLKGGFGFFLGFCAGFALRTFFKATALVLGVIVLALLGLGWVGVVDVDWAAFEQHYDRIAGHVRGQAESFRAFVNGSLPSAGLAALGLLTGFRRG